MKVIILFAVVAVGVAQECGFRRGAADCLGKIHNNENPDCAWAPEGTCRHKECHRFNNDAELCNINGCWHGRMPGGAMDEHYACVEHNPMVPIQIHHEPGPCDNHYEPAGCSTTTDCLWEEHYQMCVSGSTKGGQCESNNCAAYNFEGGACAWNGDCMELTQYPEFERVERCNNMMGENGQLGEWCGEYPQGGANCASHGDEKTCHDATSGSHMAGPMCIWSYDTHKCLADCHWLASSGPQECQKAGCHWESEWGDCLPSDPNDHCSYHGPEECGDVPGCEWNADRHVCKSGGSLGGQCQANGCPYNDPSFTDGACAWNGDCIPIYDTAFYGQSPEYVSGRGSYESSCTAQGGEWCPGTGTKHNCLTKEVWTDEKKDWCCKHEQIGCQDDQCAGTGCPRDLCPDGGPRRHIGDDCCACPEAADHCGGSTGMCCPDGFTCMTPRGGGGNRCVGPADGQVTAVACPDQQCGRCGDRCSTCQGPKCPAVMEYWDNNCVCSASNNPEDCNAPPPAVDCKTCPHGFYDGCNTCSCHNGATQCTLKHCINFEAPYCLVPPSDDDGSKYCDPPRTVWNGTHCNGVCDEGCPCDEATPCFDPNRKTQCIAPSHGGPQGGSVCADTDTDCHCPPGSNWQMPMYAPGYKGERKMHCVENGLVMGRPFMHGAGASVAALASDNMFLDV